jgi:hypothetical protein
MADLAEVLHCSECGDPISSTQIAYQRIHGWEQRRKAGGANMIVAREVEDKWACEVCIGKLRRGINPAQERLI